MGMEAFGTAISIGAIDAVLFARNIKRKING